MVAILWLCCGGRWSCKSEVESGLVLGLESVGVSEVLWRCWVWECVTGQVVALIGSEGDQV